MTHNITESQIFSWIDISLQHEDIENYSIKLSGSSEKSEGYTTDITFVKVKGTKKSKLQEIEIHLVLKVSKDVKYCERMGLLDFYSRESLIYNIIFPEFTKFQKRRMPEVIFNNFPKCYGTLSTDGRSIIILENLRTQGFEEYNRLVPMNIHHMKMVLKSYAKLHAISFAFRYQHLTDFKKLTENYSDVFCKFIFESSLSLMIEPKIIMIKDLVEKVDAKLAKQIETVFEPGVLNIAIKLQQSNLEDESVIRHGDCWNSNFLFQYQNNNKECPTEVMILDWQASSYNSPLLDLAYFMFVVSSTEQVNQFDLLIKYYHDNLAHYILELGCDPNKLFPFSKCLEHWKKYSIIGLIMALTFLDVFMCNKTAAIKLDDFNNEEDLNQALLNNRAENPEQHLERIVAVCRYYFNLVEQ